MAMICTVRVLLTATRITEPFLIPLTILFTAGSFGMDVKGFG